MTVPYQQHVKPEFDTRMNVYRTTHDEARPWPPSTTTVLALADLTGTNPTAMLPLAGAVDTETLNDHVYRNGSDVELTFEYQGFVVTVWGDGRIEFDPVAGQEGGVSEQSHVQQHGTWSTHACE